MLQKIADTMLGKHEYDLVIQNVQIVNVYNDTIRKGEIGIVEGKIGEISYNTNHLKGKKTIDGNNKYAIPGFIDSHMHLESSMLTPNHFAEIALSCGTTTVAADPHEIANVMGIKGVKSLVEACLDLPLNVYVFAPSTIPSLPGFESSGFDVTDKEMDEMLNLKGVIGLGEVMDFNAVSHGEKRMIDIIQAATDKGVLLDGHVAALTGKDLQIFRAMDIDSDHTLGTAEKLLEELSLGFTVQIQEGRLNKELVKAMNEATVSDRICIVTDDVPLPRLIEHGHMNYVVERAIELGLNPVKAIRFATINGATRLRLYHTGAIAPGNDADIQLVEDLRHPKPEVVIKDGNIVYEDNKFKVEIPAYIIPEDLKGSVNVKTVTTDDFKITVPVSKGFKGGTAIINTMKQDGSSIYTKLVQKEVNISEEHDGKAVVETSPYLKMAVFNRYGTYKHSLGIIDGMSNVQGAIAITYGHDAHNLTVYGGNDKDMVVAANAVIQSNGGICAVRNQKVLSLIPLPMAGLLSDLSIEDLYQEMKQLLLHAEEMGFVHQNLLTFLTLMTLAVSPDVKLSDLGLVDVINKKFLPLVVCVKENN